MKGLLIFALVVTIACVHAQFGENMAQNMMMASLFNKGGSGMGMNPFLMASMLNGGGAKMDKILMWSLLGNMGGGNSGSSNTASRG